MKEEMKHRCKTLLLLFSILTLFTTESNHANGKVNPPILILGTPKHFGDYTGEILKAEGFNEFQIDCSDINFAKRRVNTIEQILSTKYSFTNKMGITFRARHYLSTVENKEFYLLQPDGSLLTHTNFHPDANQNVNYFNIDMVYTWEFAPGSFLNIVWKNAAQSFTNDVEKQYFKNFGNTISGDSNNNFSLKVIYFLDYLKLKRHIDKHRKNS